MTVISEQDISLVEKELGQTQRPMPLRALTEKLAFQKTASQRIQDVKIYDPNCRYEVGDFLYKEYDENLTVGSKNQEHFQGTVILRVINKIPMKAFHCEMLEVDYTGGGPFRKYVDYMKKTRTQVMLPSNYDEKNLAPEIMPKAEDPRLTELPMTDRDLKTLEKNLRSGLSKSQKFFGWNDIWQLSSRRIEIPEEKIKEIEGDFEKSRASAATGDMVKKHFGLEASQDLFEIHCLSLNALLEKKYRKEFIALSLADWGKWHLKKILNSLPDGLPISAPMAKIPETGEVEKAEMSVVSGFPIKVYLTWREILSGGIKIPRSLSKELSAAREFLFTDPDEGKSYTVYYYPQSNFFLGLKEFYEQHNIPQGTSLTLEKKGPAEFHFWVKKSKKKISVPKLAYDSREDRFIDSGEEVFTFSEPNKIIYLEAEILGKLLPLYEQRDELDLHDLLVLIFKSFGLSTNNSALHFLRAYHLVDVIKQTTQEDVELTLISSAEFTKSDKKKGIFFYEEPFKPEEAVEPETPAEIPAELPAELEAETAPEEIEAEAAPLEGGVEEPAEEAGAPVVPVTAPAEPRAEKEKVKAVPVVKKGKAFKRKKPRAEGEKGPRPKKSERRVIEEKIADAESELEALAAVKEQEEELEEKVRAAREKKEVARHVPKEEPKFGFFAEKLKSALTVKKKEDKKEDDKGEDEAEIKPE
ncbi:MAG TPA: hypothetical protein PLX50_03505 [Candidatus Aminicenantes bacterium]|nr:hypothetical protein [Candidatus Aminicenantes bacterium]